MVFFVSRTSRSPFGSKWPRSVAGRALLFFSSVGAAAALVFASCVALTAFAPHVGKVYWSPYQRLIIRLFRMTSVTMNSFCDDLRTNDSWSHQQMFNLSPEKTGRCFTRSCLLDRPAPWNPYNMPYRFFQNPPAVLVLGVGGIGNDAAAAVRNGAHNALWLSRSIRSFSKLGFASYTSKKPHSSLRVGTWRLTMHAATSRNSNEKVRPDHAFFTRLAHHQLLLQ